MVVQYNDSTGAAPKTIHIINPVTHLIMDGPRNWSRNVLLWNLAADALFRPYTDRGGCPSCQGAVTIESDSVTYNLAYYALAHASKFVRPGSVRIYSTEPDGLQNIAYTTPKGEKVVLVANTGATDRSFFVGDGTNRVLASLPAKSVATYIWK
jgi:glucosylceramidase